MKKTMLFLAALTVLAGCVKHGSIDRSLKVGNIYCNDGSAIDPITYKEKNMDNGVGVIFWVNEKEKDSLEEKAFIVSLDEMDNKCFWCDTLITTRVTSSINSFDGAENTNTLQKFAIKNNCEIPATTHAVQYNKNGIENWYLPSVGQLLELYKNKNVIEKSIEACNGRFFDNVWYWSSNEDNANVDFNAYIVSVKEGRIQTAQKTFLYRTRPVKAIK